MEPTSTLIPVVIIIVIAVILIGIAVWFFLTRKHLQAASLEVDGAWNDVADQLKRRGDLVPNLVVAVREFAGEGQQVYGELEQANQDAVSSSSPRDAAAAENRFQGALRSIFGLAAAYPQLTQQPQFLRLKADLVQTEDKIQAARRTYNGTVRQFNRQVTSFPNRLVAGSAGAHERAIFEVSDRAAIAEPPRVQF